jgi:hypothetical protein
LSMNPFLEHQSYMTELDYQCPDMILFGGIREDGKRVVLIQHYSQLSVLLVALAVSKGEAPRRIGFRLQADLEAEAASVADQLEISE